MKWIKCLECLPEIGSIILVEYFSGDYERKKYIGPEDWWLRNVNAWLDDSERSFTIKDMRNAFDSGKYAGEMETLFNNTDQISLDQLTRVTRTFDVFMDNEYGIDITK